MQKIVAGDVLEKVGQEQHVLEENVQAQMAQVKV